ncbi:DUF4097 family beta strand repeat-containing protein [Halalkalibacterium ligniniphilum]|uniref:DUF4097 family beta strand repeat-containing protein n=1 Tax=Halalkalibacterium ligniniphilum TaxID=1134413 RepID=UPI00034770D4|nr:DUF4097 family beta strand repeat-containing protein [Halalkalibacterium ligniniphilum]
MKRIHWLYMGLLVGSLLMLTACNLVTVVKEDAYTLDAGNLSSFMLDLDEGNVEITGSSDINEIQVKATFQTVGESEEEAEQFREQSTSLELEKEGTVAHLLTRVNRADQAVEGRVHLEILVPNGLSIELMQRAGELLLSGHVGDLKINHGSGPLQLHGIQGNVEITDGAGRLNLTQMTGDIRINSNSGDTVIDDVIGNMSVITGSGNVDITNIDGSLDIRSGTGEIEINSVTGDVTVLERGGEITIENVQGTITQ